jgi:hypothetical protein
MLENKLMDNTIIDAGHYSYLSNPTKLDLYLWEKGVKLYARAREKYQNIGLMLLVDDMKGVESNQQRRTFRIEELPEAYLTTLEHHGIDREEVQVVSQDRMKQKGRQLLKQQRKSRSTIAKCELIAATTVRHKQLQGYENSINLYDVSKTTGGITMVAGTQKAEKHFGTTIECHYFIFKDKDNYYYFHLKP